MSTLANSVKPRVSAADFIAAQSMRAEERRRAEAMGDLRARAQAQDAFSNIAARIGFGSNNLQEGANYPLTRLSYNWYLLISLYRSNWLISKMIDSIADDMLKNWVSFPTELAPAKVKKLEQAFTLTGTQDKILQTLKWARLFGGAGAVIIIKGQKLEDPLDFDDIPLDSYRGVIPFDRWSGITPSATVCSDLDRPLDYGLPETYRLSTEQGGGIEVHCSRVLRFTGRIMPAWEFQADQRWGVSEVERAFEELKKRDNTSFNLASLIFRANIFELRQKGLSQMISGLNANPQTQAAFASALQAQTALMSNQGIVVSDPEGGGLSTHQYGFAGIAEVYSLFQRDWCAACEIPFSRMFGHEGGLGANGEGDEHAYYDNIGQKQKREVNPQFQKLMPAVAMSTWGKIPSDFEWKFNPVNSPSDKQKSELASTYTTSVVEAFNSGIVSQQTAGKELKQMSSVVGLWDNITDADIEKMSDEAMGGEMQEAALMQPDAEEDEGTGLADKPGKKEKSLEKPKVERKAKSKAKDAEALDVFPHDLRHPTSGKFTKAPLQHSTFAGLPVVIENPAGSVRSGRDMNGKAWSVKMTYPYGYIARTEGADGDPVDVFLGPDEDAEKCYVIHTKNPVDGVLDEDKLFIGFGGADAAVAAFYENYSDRAYLAGIEMVAMSDLPEKLAQYRGRMIEAYQ